MKPVKQTNSPNPLAGWRLSNQHQLALAVLASLALGAIALWCGWSTWKGEGDVDRAAKIPLEFQVNINQATTGELMAIPGVGPKMAAAIVNQRDLRGSFKDHAQLQEVAGIGPKKLKQLKKYLLPIEP